MKMQKTDQVITYLAFKGDTLTHSTRTERGMGLVTS